MKSIFISLLCAFLASTAFGASKNCDSFADLNVKYSNEHHPSHELTITLGTMKVGGAEEKYPRNIDHLAIQRSLVRCAPGVLKCFKEKGKLPAEIVMTFQLNPAGEISTASDFKFSSKFKTSPQLDQCLNKVLSEIQFGLILKESAAVQMPVQMK